MNTPSDNFKSHFQTERDALKAFVSLLESEQESLLGGDTDKLVPLVESKTKAVHELNTLAASRRNGLLSHGVPVEASSGITDWLQSNAVSSVPLWREIQQLAEQAQHLNRSNGLLIQNRLRHNQQMLSALFTAANSANNLYGPDGQARVSGGGRTLGNV